MVLGNGANCAFESACILRCKLGQYFRPQLNGTSDKKISLAIFKGTLVSDGVPFAIDNTEVSSLNFLDL